MIKGESTERREIILYNPDGSKMKQDEQPRQLEIFWTSLYGARSNNIEEVWNLEKRNEYEQQHEDTKERISEYLRVEEDRNWTE